MVEVNRLNVAALYVATFDRAADAAGLDYWINDSGLTTAIEIERSFMAQPEAASIVGLTNREAVEMLYANLFNKAPADDVAGINYWVSDLDSGRVQIEDIILALYDGALGDDKTIMTNKAEVSLTFADAGLDDIVKADEIVSGVTADPATVAAADAKIQLWENEGAGFQLTTSEDDIQGGSQDDVIEGSTNSAVATSTFQSFDNIDGGQGNDTLNLRMTNGATTATAIVNNIETLNITNQDASDVFDGVQTTGLDTINVNGVGTSMTLNNLQNVVELGFNQLADGATNVVFANYAPAAISGTADTQVVNLNTTDTAVLVSNGIETLDLHTTTGAQNFIDASGAATVEIEGAANLIYTDVTGSAAMIDATTATGNLTINASNTGNATVNGGSGNDIINGAITGIGKTVTINGNAGDDTINLGNTATGAMSQVTGGTGVDIIRLATITGIDTINFARTGDTGIAQSNADHIVNFASGTDFIDFAALAAGTGVGTVTSTGTTALVAIGDTFVINTTTVAGFSSAETAANAAFNIAGDTLMYSFQSDGVDGYLFVDSDLNGRADEVIILDGLATAAAMTQLDIV